jgi:pimeloyl-ACP methyl ester carboxylesterase
MVTKRPEMTHGTKRFNLLQIKKEVLKIALFTLLILSSTSLLEAQEINRKAHRGFSYRIQENQKGVFITKVEEGSPIHKSGLREGDILLKCNNNEIEGYESVSRILSQLPSEKTLNLTIERDGKIKNFDTRLNPLPKEAYENTIVEYNRFQLNNESIRTIITKPKTPVEKKLPAVMLVQWLSCGSIDIPGNPADGMDFTIKSFADNPNIIFYRVEKNGVGDSRGTACIDLDAATEIATYKKGLEELKKRSDVDTTQIYILGLSLGTSLAPIVGEGQNVKGYMVSGGTTESWYEHMLEFERNRLTLSGTSPTDVNKAMKSFSDFYSQYLIHKKTPEQILKQNTAYSDLWYDDPRHQFGRSAEYYQQIQDLNFEEAWSNISVPVLAVYGEYDWVMSLRDHERIIDLVNKNQDIAELVVLLKTNHLLSSFNTPKEAFEDETGKINPEAYNKMWNWLEQKIMQ